MSIKRNFEIKFFNLEIKNIFFCIVNFIVTCFVMGTVLLLYFVKTILLFLKNISLGALWEDLIVFLLILMSVVIVFYLALVLTSFIINSRKNILKWSILITEFLAFALAVSFWINPYMLIKRDAKEYKITLNDNQFTFGEYPDEERLLRLKEDKYDVIITLMNPGVFPFESRLLNDELKSAKKIGIDVIAVPLFPWLSNKEDAIKKFDEVAGSEKGKIYVHEFIGGERLDLFRKRIEFKKHEMNVSQKKAFKKLDEVEQFERGEIIKLDNGIYFTPYPSEREIIDYILPSKVKSVISLMDDKNPEDTVWINKEKKMLEANSIPFIIRPISIKPYDPVSVFETSLFVRGLPRPVVVHAYYTKSVASEGFVLTFKNQIKSFPPSLFSKPLKNGKVALILPNILAGPKPTLAEYKNSLYNNGVRGIIYCDSIKKSLGIIDKSFFSKIGLSWEQVKLNNLPSKKELKAGGMWYIYGADSIAIKKQFK